MALVVAATLTLSAFGLPPVAGGTPVSAAASCTKFFESNIEGWAMDFAYGPQNRLWLTENFSPALLRGVSPAGGLDVRYTLGDVGAAARIADPQGIAVGADGRLWITGQGDQKIAAVDPATGALTTWPLDGGPARLAKDASGFLWVTLNSADAIAKVNTSGALVAQYALPAGARPLGIVIGGDNAIWFTEPGRNAIGRIDPLLPPTNRLATTEYVVGGAPQFLVPGLAADLWYTKLAASAIGHITLAGASLPDVDTPTSASGPTGITIGADNAVWFTEHHVHKIGRLDPLTSTINETIVNTSTQPPGPIIALPATVDGTIWFGIEAPHLEHFKPKPDGTVGPLPPSIALTAGSPVQPGPVYSTTTPFTIAATAGGQCVDNIFYRVYLQGTPPPATFTPVGPAGTTFTLGNGTWIVEFYGVGPGGTSVTQSTTLVINSALFGDTVPPVIAPLPDRTTLATSPAGAVVTFVATAIDAKDGPRPVICDPPSGSTFKIGTTTVTCTSVDLSGNKAIATFTVTVDPGPPVVTVPANVVIAATGATTTVTFAASALSPWGGPLPVTCTPPGTTLPSPATFTFAFTSNTPTTVTCVSAMDGFGRQGTATFTVTPITPPTLSLPANMTVTATGPLTPVPFTATATGAGGTVLPVTCTPPSGTGFAPGTTLVTCVASDRGISSTGTFTVTVSAPPPTLVLPADISLIVTGTSAVVTYTATASSVVDGTLVPTCTPPSGSTFLLGTTVVTCTVTDARGKTTTGTFRVTIANTQASTLTITSLPVQNQGTTVVSAKLLGPGGTPIAGRTITFTAGAKTATGITNASGVATAALPLAPGLYTLNATFAGDASYRPSSATSPLTVLPKGCDDTKGNADTGNKTDNDNNNCKDNGDKGGKDQSTDGGGKDKRIEADRGSEPLRLSRG